MTVLPTLITTPYTCDDCGLGVESKATLSDFRDAQRGPGLPAGWAIVTRFEIDEVFEDKHYCPECKEKHG